MEKHPPIINPSAAEGSSDSTIDRQAIEALATEYGSGFYAYLHLTDHEQNAEILRTDYLARYQGSYDDFEEFARSRLTEVGIARLSKELGIEISDDHPDDIYITAAYLRTLYDVVPMDSLVYVFRREAELECAPASDALIDPLQIEPLTHPPTPGIEISWPGLVGPKPKSRRDLRILERLYDTFNTAFEVYLEHIWQDAPIEGLEDDMLNVYQGSYSSVAEFIDALAESLGWKQAIEKTMREMVIPPGTVAWNYRVIYQDLTRDFDFHQSGNQVHVFRK